MKSIVSFTKLPCVLIITMLMNFSSNAFAQTDLDDLKAENEKLKLEKENAVYEKDIAEAKSKLIEIDNLNSIKLAKDIAEAKKAEYTAKIPVTETKLSSGDMTVTSLGVSATIVALDLVDDVAKKLCAKIDKPFAIYEPTLINGIISARQLKSSIETTQEALNSALQTLTPINEHTIRVGLVDPLTIGLATGTAKAIADFMSLFKTDVTINSAPIAEGKSLLITSVAHQCAPKVINPGLGYKGELDETKYKELKGNLKNILEDNAKFQVLLAALKKSLDAEKDKDARKEERETYEKLAAIATTVDQFIKSVKIDDFSEKAPLVVAANFLKIDSEFKDKNPYLIDLDVKLDGLTILKSNIFTGKSLRLSGAMIVSYRVHEINGKLVNSDILRVMAEPLKLNLRSKSDEKRNFFQINSINNNPKSTTKP